MVDQESPHVDHAAAEIALGILPAGERHAAAEHLRSCQACRAEVDSLRSVAARLLDLVPGTEPPLGFDRKVLAGTPRAPGAKTPRHPRWVGRRATWLAAAAAVSLVFAVAGWLAGRSNGDHYQPSKPEAVAELTSSGRDVGQIEAYGKPLWLTVTVHDAGMSGAVTCQILHADGSSTTMGTFVLRNGSGSWSVPDPAGLHGATVARLVDSGGALVATGRF